MIGHFRVARHTRNLNKMKVFYIDLVGLKEIGSFSNHKGYDGLMLGLKDHTWHLEFTVSGNEPENTPDDDDLLVFYFDDKKEYMETIKRLEKNNIKSVKSINPYWDKIGKTYLDPDGYRIVICNKSWSNG